MSVHAAHAVDRHLFDERFLDEVVLQHVVVTIGHDFLLLFGDT
ncbi:hypothetical protein GFS60_05283 [Rhodococcus sp. WAY2]|nr:hypothetical protein GFS60_05283 [Rhodococcus sp. WAY2]